MMINLCVTVQEKRIAYCIPFTSWLSFIIINIIIKTRRKSPKKLFWGASMTWLAKMTTTFLQKRRDAEIRQVKQGRPCNLKYIYFSA
jgi:hypothetical protein